MTKLSRSLSCAALLLGAVFLPLHAQSYHIAKTVPLVGDGGWDYLTFDSTAHRLFIAHSTQVLVVDAESGSLLGQVPGLNGAHGVALALAEGTRLRLLGPRQQRHHVRPQDLPGAEEDHGRR